MNAQSIRQIKRDFNKVLKSKIVPTVSISFDEPGTGSDLWGNNVTPGAGYTNVKALVEIVSNLNILKYEYANVQTGKCVFYLSLEHDLKDKKNVKVIFNGTTYPIRAILPYQPLGNEFLCQILLQE